MPAPYLNALDEELARKQRDLEDELKALVKLDAEEVACYPAGFKVRTSHAYRMGLIVPIIEATRQKRMKIAEEVTLEDELEDENEPPTLVLEGENEEDPQPLRLPAKPQFASTSSPHDESNGITTLPPDIITPTPFPSSPNISIQQPQPRFRYHPSPRPHPPDILAPPPFPPSPNIFVQQPHPHIHLHPPSQPRHPDIFAPIPLPLKPNIRAANTLSSCSS